MGAESFSQSKERVAAAATYNQTTGHGHWYVGLQGKSDFRETSLSLFSLLFSAYSCQIWPSTIASKKFLTCTVTAQTYLTATHYSINSVDEKGWIQFLNWDVWVDFVFTDYGLSPRWVGTTRLALVWPLALVSGPFLDFLWPISWFLVSENHWK